MGRVTGVSSHRCWTLLKTECHRVCVTPFFPSLQLLMTLDLIHDERNSINPFQASKDSADDQKTFEDLVKIGLTEFIHDRVLRGSTPTDDDLLVEARKIIHTADKLNVAVPDPEASGFRDLIMLSGPQTEDSKIQ